MIVSKPQVFSCKKKLYILKWYNEQRSNEYIQNTMHVSKYAVPRFFFSVSSKWWAWFIFVSLDNGLKLNFTKY